MKRVPKRIFKLKGNEYIEISYEEYQQLMQQRPSPHFWLFGGMLLEVPEHAHKEMNRERSRRMYIRKQSESVEELSYEVLLSGDCDGKFVWVDERAEVGETVEQKLMAEDLQRVIGELSEEDRNLIRALFFEGCSERAYAKQIGLSQVAVHKRKKQVLEKLKDKLL